MRLPHTATTLMRIKTLFEKAKEELTDAASGALVNAQEKAERAGAALADIADKVEKKIEQKRSKPPTP